MLKEDIRNMERGKNVMLQLSNVIMFGVYDGWYIFEKLMVHKS